MRAKLEDVCVRGSSNLKQSDVIDKTGEYPIYGAAGYIGNVDFYHQDQPYVAVVKDGAGIGRTSLYPAESSVIGTMQYLLPKENVLPEYLCYVVKYMHLEKYFTGATIPHIYFKDYKKEEFNLDTLDRQKEIVNILGRIECVISSRQQELQKLDELIKARFVEMFGDREYESVLLIDTIKHGVGLSYGIVVPGDNVDDGVPMIRPSDFSNGILDLTNVYRVSKEIECKYVKTRLAGDEILVQVIGQPGQVMLATDECKGMNVTRNLAVIRPNHKMVNRLYLKQYMEKGESQQFLLKNTKQSTLKQLPLNLLKQLEVQLPPIELQNQFADFVTQVDKSKVIKLSN